MRYIVSSVIGGQLQRAPNVMRSRAFPWCKPQFLQFLSQITQKKLLLLL